MKKVYTREHYGGAVWCPNKQWLLVSCKSFKWSREVLDAHGADMFRLFKLYESKSGDKNASMWSCVSYKVS
jgi:hypothetical protein